MSKKCSVLLSCMVLFGVLLMAGYSVAGEGKLSGYMFGDYYLIAANHNEDLENMNGFQFRRIYFTYDKEISDSFSTRLRLEMSNAWDFEKKHKMEPVVKDAYLKWSAVCPFLPDDKSELLIGISPTPTWSVVEKVWGYRSVEKTPLDLQKDFGSSSRDFGVALKVKPVDILNVHLMVANGASNSSETNKDKKLLLSLGIQPSDAIIVEAYGDVQTGPEDGNVFTVQGFAAYKVKKCRVGVQFVHQTRQGESEDTKLEIGSIFAVAHPMEKVAVFARFDRMFDPSSKGSGISYIPFAEGVKSSFIVAGLDYTPNKNVHIMPNVEIVIYDEPDSGDKPDMDIIPRLTLYYKF